MANDVVIYNYVSRDAQIALTEFRTDFELAFVQSPAEQWARELGLTIQTSALSTRWPIPISAAGYVKRDGARVFRKLGEKSLEMKAQIWEDGFAEFAEVVEAPDFLGFQEEPMAMAIAASNLPNELISALLEANGICWDTKAFFATDHPSNVLTGGGTAYSNLITGAGTDLTAINIGKARQNFRKIKGPNKKSLGITMIGALIPAALEEQAARLSQQDTIIQVLGASSFGAVDNVRTKGFKYWVSDQLTDDNKWYPIGGKPGMRPWTLLDKGVPETLVLDKTSALFERERKVGMSSTFQMNGALALPQCVQSWAGTAP